MKSAIILSAISATISVSAWGLPTDTITGMGCHGPCSVRTYTEGRVFWVEAECDGCNYIDGANKLSDTWDSQNYGMLNGCFGNNDGQLENNYNGAWLASCKDIRVNDAGILTANCKNKAQVWADTSIDIAKTDIRSFDSGIGCA